MTKERIYNALERIEDKGKIIYSYIFIYGIAICFILIGRELMEDGFIEISTEGKQRKGMSSMGIRMGDFI